MKHVRELDEQAKRFSPSEHEKLLEELASTNLSEYPTWSAETHGEWEEQTSKKREPQSYNDWPRGWGWVYPNEEDEERRKNFLKYGDYNEYRGNPSKNGCRIM